jgi:hypothetical protein
VLDIDHSFLFDDVLLRLVRLVEMYLARAGWAALLVTCGQGARRVNGKIQSQVGAERGGSVSSGLAHGVAAGQAAVVLKSKDAPGLIYGDYLMFFHIHT